MVQIPLAEKKSELKVDGYLSPEHFGGWGFNGQYTLTNHLFITAQHFQEQRYNISGADTRYKYNLSEAGAGYYSGSSHLKYGAFGTIGYGVVKGNFNLRYPFGASGPPMTFDVNAKFIRVSGTFYIGALEKNYTYGFAARLSYISYPSYYYTLATPTDPSQPPSPALYDIYNTNSPDLLFIEPVAYISTNDRYLNFFFECGFSLPARYHPADYITSYPLIASGGIYVKLFTKGDAFPSKDSGK